MQLMQSMLTCKSWKGNEASMKKPQDTHEMTQPIDIQALQPQGHTRPELAWRLSRVQGKRVPEPTLTRWLSELCIEPNQFGLSSQHRGVD